ncbi:MAG: hypothetical protein ABI345_00295 [Jatrophihabitans sp.]
MRARGTVAAVAALLALAGCSSVVKGSGGSNASASSAPGTTSDFPSTGGAAPPPGPIGSSGAASSGPQTPTPSSSTAGSVAPALGADLVAFVRAGKPVSESDYAWTRDEPGGPRVPSYGSERYLVSPTKNIACFLDKQVTCTIKERSYPDPPKRDCHEIGFIPNYVEVSGDTVYRGLCLGGLPYSPFGNVLPYGSTLRVGDYACRSDMNFLACADLVTTRGFVLSRTLLRAG